MYIEKNKRDKRDMIIFFFFLFVANMRSSQESGEGPHNTVPWTISMCPFPCPPHLISFTEPFPTPSTRPYPSSTPISSISYSRPGANLSYTILWVPELEHCTHHRNQFSELITGGSWSTYQNPIVIIHYFVTACVFMRNTAHDVDWSVSRESKELKRGGFYADMTTNSNKEGPWWWTDSKVGAAYTCGGPECDNELGGLVQSVIAQNWRGLIVGYAGAGPPNKKQKWFYCSKSGRGNSR